MIRDCALRLKAPFRRKALEEELDAELRFHFDHQVEKFVESGIPLVEAQRRARLAIGGEEQIKEECRDARGLRFLESLAQDARYGLRALRKSPGFTVVGVVTLMLGIGVNTALFTIVHGVLLNPLPFPRSDRLVSLWEENVVGASACNPVSGGVFADWRGHREPLGGWRGVAGVNRNSPVLLQSVSVAGIAAGVGTRFHRRRKNAQALLLSDNLVRDVKQPLYLLMGAVLCVLLIACLNVANLFMARVTSRRREIAVRAALGGSRWRIVQEQVTESLLLTLAGGSLGALLALVLGAKLPVM